MTTNEMIDGGAIKMKALGDVADGWTRALREGRRVMRRSSTICSAGSASDEPGGASGMVI